MKRTLNCVKWGAAFLPLLLVVGCVERTVKIETHPPGAVVVVNDEEVGLSPVKFSFLWYGDYDVVIRKDGYETLKTHFKVDAPWYQYPPFDVVAETLVAKTIHDDHEKFFELQPKAEPDFEAIVDHAIEMRRAANR